jgi:hypothetical protein
MVVGNCKVQRSLPLQSVADQIMSYHPSLDKQKIALSCKDIYIKTITAFSAHCVSSTLSIRSAISNCILSKGMLSFDLAASTFFLPLVLPDAVHN